MVQYLIHNNDFSGQEATNIRGDFTIQKSMTAGQAVVWNPSNHSFRVPFFTKGIQLLHTSQNNINMSHGI